MSIMQQKSKHKQSNHTMLEIGCSPEQGTWHFRKHLASLVFSLLNTSVSK